MYSVTVKFSLHIYVSVKGEKNISYCRGFYVHWGRGCMSNIGRI